MDQPRNTPDFRKTEDRMQKAGDRIQKTEDRSPDGGDLSLSVSGSASVFCLLSSVFCLPGKGCNDGASIDMADRRGLSYQRKE
jgi:hypothetical protein